jgi:arsenate reductase (thioredoxin)
LKRLARVQNPPDMFIPWLSRYYPGPKYRAKDFAPREFQGQSFDFVITVCGRAKETCPVWPGQPVTAHWGFEDPAEATGTDEQKLRIFRNIFTEIQTRIGLFLALPIEKLSRLELETKVRQLGQKETI